jgi:hypothetical protein
MLFTFFFSGIGLKKFCNFIKQNLRLINDTKKPNRLNVFTTFIENNYGIFISWKMML